MPLSLTDGDRDHVTWNHFGQSDSGIKAVGHYVDKSPFRDYLELHIAIATQELCHDWRQDLLCGSLGGVDSDQSGRC
jgi:hypothetical protein